MSLQGLEMYKLITEMTINLKRMHNTIKTIN